MACGRPKEEAEADCRGEDANDEVKVGAMEKDDDCDSGSAVKGGVSGEWSGSCFILRTFVDGYDVMVGAKLRCCKKSSK